MRTIKLNFILGLFAFLGTTWATDLCGFLYMPTTLTKAKSPYHITGDIFIPTASRLTIEAGVELIVASKESCTGDIPQRDWSDSQFVSIKVDGAFYVKGTPTNPVIVHPEQNSKGKVLWDGIRLRGLNPSKAKIQFLQVQGANRALQIEQSTLQIQNSIFTDNNTGIWLGLKGNVEISNCLFAENTSAAIFLDHAAPEIMTSIFYQNPNYGIWADSRKGLRIHNNLFWKSGEANCYHCSVEIGKRTGVNGKNDSIDVDGNLFSDPIFVGTHAEQQQKHLDPNEPTSNKTVLDTGILKVSQKADSLGKAGLPPRPVFQTQGTGVWILSQYSPALDAAPDESRFKDANGTHGDLGPWGATAKYSVKDP
jgi:hypothetical protein